VTIYQKNGKESIEYANTLSNIANVLDNRGYHKSAFKYYNRAAAIYQKNGKELINYADILSNIGIAYKNRGNCK
jgi:tetratricopeptide (TPR) repeat protein